MEEIYDLTEIKVIQKKRVKYYSLFLYREHHDIPDKYFMLHQSMRLEDIEKYKKDWTLSDGDEFRIFCYNLPA